MDENKIQDFNMIIDSFLEEGGNDNGEFVSWVRTLTWYDKNIVASMLIERFFDENEKLMFMFKEDAQEILHRYRLH
jgi:hypothetical protein